MKQQEITNKRKAGRPRAFDREHALSVALDLFWRHGFDGTSIPLLTEAMCISPPSLYAAFGSKESLYREAVKLYLARYNNFMLHLLDANCSAKQAIERALLEAAKQFASTDHAPGCMISSAELQVSPGNEQLAEEIANIRLTAKQLVHKRLESARKTGEIPKNTDTTTLAAYFAMVTQGMSVQARDGAKTAELNKLAKMAMQVWPQN